MRFIKKEFINSGDSLPLCAIFARIVVTLLLLSTAFAEEVPWKFLVMSDWHGAEPYSYKPGKSGSSFRLQKDALEHIRNLYGGDLVLIPGDTNGGRWFRQEWVNKHFPGYSIQAAVYKAGINCYGTLKKLYSSAGYKKLLVSIGDHELGDNYWGPHGADAKTDSLTQFRASFVQALYKHPNTNKYIFKNRIGNTQATPRGTDYEYTSFAHKHKNVLFITVDVFHEVSNQDYFDRENGLGGEGIITGDVTGSHLKWFEKVLIEARKDDSIYHIIVQAHLPILMPVRSISSSGMFFDRAQYSSFWKIMVKYGVDIYLAGEVHANTASKTKNSNLVQVVSRSKGQTNFLEVTVTKDSLQLDAINEIGPERDPHSKSKFENIGTLVIDKLDGITEISSSGELELLDVSKALLHFDFEELHGVSERQIIGLKTEEMIRLNEVVLRGKVVNTAIWNKGSFGKQYDAPVGNVKIEQGGVIGKSGKFSNSSQMGVYSMGPHRGGSVISYSIWVSTLQKGEIILIHFGPSWPAGNTLKNIFSLTLKNGIPKLYASQSSFLQPKGMGGNALNDGGWHQIAVSMPNRSCRLSQVKLYIDGINTKTSVQNDIPLFFLNHGRISIGGLGFSATPKSAFPTWKPFNGNIDEVYVWGKTVEKQQLRKSPGKNLHHVQNSWCATGKRRGMKVKTITSIKKEERCKNKCRNSVSCLGIKVVELKNNTQEIRCTLFKNKSPLLYGTTEKEDEKCFIIK